MRRVLLGAVVVLSCVLVVGTQAICDELSDIIAKAKAQQAEFDKDVKDITMTSEMKFDSPQATMTTQMKVMKKGDRARTEQLMPIPGGPEMQIIAIFDGKDTWIFNPMMGKQKAPAGQRIPSQTSQDWWKHLSENAKLLGSDKIGDRDCYVIEAPEEKTVTKLWLDKNGLTAVQVENGAPGQPTSRIVFSDFKKLMDKWPMPYKGEIYSGSNHVGTLTVKSVDINKGLSDDLFDPDKVEMKPLVMPQMPQPTPQAQ